MCDEEADGDLDERAQGREGGAPRRTAERKLRRANAGGTERGREGEGVGEDPHHRSELLRLLDFEERRRSGELAAAPSSTGSNGAAVARARVLASGNKAAASMEVKGGTGGAFYRLGRCPWRAGHAETMRATRGRGGLGRVLPAHEGGDDPDMRAPHGSGGGRERRSGPGCRLGRGREWAGAWRSWAGRKKRRKKEGWAGWASRGGKRRAFVFLN